MRQSTLGKLEYCYSILGLEPPSYHMFMLAVARVEEVLEYLANESMKRAILLEDKGDLFALSDCGWNFQ